MAQQLFSTILRRQYDSLSGPKISLKSVTFETACMSVSTHVDGYFTKTALSLRTGVPVFRFWSVNNIRTQIRIEKDRFKLKSLVVNIGLC